MIEKLSGYFIKDIKKYAEFSEKIGELKSTKNFEELKKLEEIRENYLIGLIKRYG